MLNDIFNKRNINKLRNMYIKLKSKIQENLESKLSQKNIDQLTDKINDKVNNLSNTISNKIDDNSNNINTKKDNEWKVKLEVEDISSKPHIHTNKSHENKHNKSKTTDHSIGNSTPKNQLSYGEIVFLDWCSNHTYEYVPSYFFYDFDMDTDKALNFLIKDGFLTEASNEYKIKFLKVNELKDILRENKMKVSGKKQDLIKRIKDNLNTNDYSEKLNFISYQPTEKGQQILKDNETLVWARKKHFGSIKASDTINKDKEQVLNDVKQKIKDKITNKEMHELYYYLLDAFKIVNSNKDYEYALVIQIMASIICLSGLACPAHDLEDKAYYTFYDFSFIKPQTDKFRTLKRRNKMSDEDMINIESKVFDQLFKQINQPVLFNSKEEYLQLMQYSCYEDNDDKLNNYIKELFNKMPEKYKYKSPF
ncbi:SAP domain-containing protein (plasmid) [Apilactobacillus apisilvae]|uniref:SAP domain-containing protein n=1 Tax=Apilactobacillus apisilvae TaxID=2923364 RepID=A0ABY4PJV9_9LACO|nr:SAP domain-containing protein [Apilactobacillus apisilvae]UQS85837.1 SAP domain-containing protein [Apilactobacillus apisilvae]